MNLGRLSINQPILAMVLSIVLLIVGAIAYPTLPVSEYPQVVPPTVTVTTQYPGASAQTVSDTVAAPIEQEINGVEDMLYLYSQATSNGQLTITATFKLGTDLDKAQVLVQNRVAIAQPRLPEEVQRNGVVTRKNSPDILMVVFMLSPDDSFDQLYISNYALLQVRDQLLRLDGVGDILAPIASGAIKESDVLGDHYDLASGKVRGRLSDTDITFFKNAGGGHLDLMTCEIVFARLGKELR